MPTLKDLYKDAVSDAPDLIVVPRHAQWLELAEEDQVYSPEAIQHAVDVLSGKRKKPRVGRISASAIGGCRRAALFTYHGAPQEPFSLDSVEMMRHGTLDHLRWQMEGITMGWIRNRRHAELFLMDEHYPVGGSLDALMFDDSVFELKTVGGFIFRNVVSVTRSPKAANRLQTGVYMRTAYADQASVLYENRDTGKHHEFRVSNSPRLQDEVEEEMSALTMHVKAGTLPEMLPGCKAKTGTEFAGCPYRKHCPLTDNDNQTIGRRR